MRVFCEIVIIIGFGVLLFALSPLIHEGGVSINALAVAIALIVTGAFVRSGT